MNDSGKQEESLEADFQRSLFYKKKGGQSFAALIAGWEHESKRSHL